MVVFFLVPAKKDEGEEGDGAGNTGEAATISRFERGEGDVAGSAADLFCSWILNAFILSCLFRRVRQQKKGALELRKA